MFENVNVKQRMIGKRHRVGEDSLMSDVRNCESSQVCLVIFPMDNVLDVLFVDWTYYPVPVFKKNVLYL